VGMAARTQITMYWSVTTAAPAHAELRFQTGHLAYAVYYYP